MRDAAHRAAPQVKHDELSLGQTKITNWRFDSTPEALQRMKDALAAR